MSLIRVLGCLAVLALLSACAGQHPSAKTEAAQYAARAHGDYTPPGPPGDPWGPYITEASAKYDVPDRWIREVMRIESGGKLYQNGHLITSGPGAMGLMQVMPDTYDELRARYSLGDDPYDPHNNILAGTAYIREMYDLYGSPGFLAAYNAGPGRLDDYLSRNRPLPDETRRYVARIAPAIADAAPVNRSPAEQYAMNALPMDIPPGPRYGRNRGPVQLAARAPSAPSRQPAWREPVQVAQLPGPPRSEAPPTPQLAYVPPPPQRSGGFRLVSTAMADTLPAHRGGPVGGAWAIQVGAFGNEGQARTALGAAKQQAAAPLAQARPAVTGVQQGKSRLYRARMTGLSRDAAVQACEKLSRGRGPCIVLSPDAQS